MQQPAIMLLHTRLPGAGEGHTSMRSKLASRQLTAQRLGMPIIRKASLPQAYLLASAAQTGSVVSMKCNSVSTARSGSLRHWLLHHQS